MADAALVGLFMGEDDDAFAEIYRRHHRAVGAHVLRRVWDPGVAEEVSQEVFLVLWRHPDRFDPARGNLRAYLFAVARGRSVDRMRTDHARRRREFRSHTVDRLPEDVDDQVMQLLKDGPLRRALTALPDRQRVPLELAYFGHLTYQEVACLLGVPEGTTKSRIRSGITRLKALLIADDSFGDDLRESCAVGEPVP